MVDMSVKIGSVTLKNPIMPASGVLLDRPRAGDGPQPARRAGGEDRVARVSRRQPAAARSRGRGRHDQLHRPCRPRASNISSTTRFPTTSASLRPWSPNITRRRPRTSRRWRATSDLPDVDVIEMNISCPTRDPERRQFRPARRTTPSRSCAASARPPTSRSGRSSRPMPARSLPGRAGGGGGRGRRADHLQHAPRPQDRHRHLQAGDRQRLRRALGTRHQADHRAHGPPVRQGGKDPDHRLRRHRQSGRRGRVHACRARARS